MITKKVYLTIDDGPSKYFKDKIAYLYERNIPAVFFCLGENLIRYESDVLDAINKGFIIGNHSFNHRYFSDQSLDECKDSIQKTDEIIEALYKKSGIDRRMKLFRFPYFDQGGDMSGEVYEGKWSKPQNEWFLYEREDKRVEIQSLLRNLGYVQPRFEGVRMKYFVDKSMFEGVDVRSTFDQMEYFLGMENAPYGMNEEQAILGRIDEDVPYEGRSLNCLDTSDIILVHDHESTTELFFKIINRYVEKNFEFMMLPGIVK